jgi:hypothetical protein
MSRQTAGRFTPKLDEEIGCITLTIEFQLA